MLLPAAGHPLLWHLIARLKTVSGIHLIIATSDRVGDDVIERLCREAGVDCLRGDPEDVLCRYVRAAELFDFQVLVRITGDCPLMDPVMVQTMIENFLKGNWDYYCNLRPRSFPRGLDCEIFTADLLYRAFRMRRLEDVPEYVVIPFVEREKTRLKIGNHASRGDYSSLRWTLDESADYELIRRIYDALYAQKPLFRMRDILNFIEKNPELKTLNAHVEQKSKHY